VRDLYEIEDKTVNRTTFRNIGNEDAYGASVFANINIGKLSLNGGGDVFYAMLNNNSPDPNVAASNEGWVVSGRLFGNYTLNKGWGLQLFSFYRGNRVDLQGQQGGFYMYSVAVRKEFNEKRGSVGIGIENFLQEYIRIKSTVETPTLQQTNINKMYNSSIRLNFSYRIGKMSMDQQPRRSRRSINNDDLKDGGDNNMGGDQGGGQQQPQRGGGGFTPQMGGQRPGQGQQQKPAEVKPDTSSAVFEAAGTWNYTIDSPQGGNGTIVINNDNGTYTGTIKNARMPEATTLANVVVKGNDVSFSYPVNFGGNSSTVEVKYRVNKDAITGTMNIGNFRSFNLTGTRGQ
jgi:hypothetical protein